MSKKATTTIGPVRMPLRMNPAYARKLSLFDYGLLGGAEIVTIMK